MANLATKYRPKTFKDIIGQENIVEILKNQVKTGNIKHAYLFSGPAGTGKTTIARILARVLNGNNRGITEIDAASNNSVDNIRTIIDDVKFKPMDTKYKIYVVDECHMLSTGAWNALLKTLEEPPEYVIFILATTDPQKIPATILSRCQRFDFKKVSTKQISERLAYIVDKENSEIAYNSGGDQDAVADPNWAKEEGILQLDVDPDVFDYIAKLSNGGVRDAISMLDTCLGYKSALDLKDVGQILGTSDYKIMFKLLNNLLSGNTGDGVKTIDKLFNDGKDLKKFILQFMEFIIEVKKYSILKDFEFINISKLYKSDLEAVNPKRLLDLYDYLCKLSYQIKYEQNVKFLVEGAVLYWEQS